MSEPNFANFDADLLDWLSRLKRRQTLLTLNAMLEFACLFIMAVCWIGFGLHFLGLLQLEKGSEGLLYLLSCAAPLALLLFAWHHQWYYRSQAQSTLRRLTNYVIEKKEKSL